uniref:Ig-like domain-containing protein n=1 Tax=Spermophilus dauricus TaxID=99837 RepID=A0A8C9PE04_SPEDA
QSLVVNPYIGLLMVLSIYLPSGKPIELLKRTHSLHYHYLTLSEPGPGLPKFLAVGYVDDQPFIRYDSRRGKAELQAPWMALVDPQYWETETQKQRAWEKVQQVEMWTVMGYHNQSGEPPMVQVTKHTTQDGTMLRCWALGFYPPDISLSWWLGRKELVLETEHVETRPSGDGTYQTWTSVQVPAGKEAWYTCHVQHPGLKHTLTVAWGEELTLRRSQDGEEGAVIVILKKKVLLADAPL